MKTDTTTGPEPSVSATSMPGNGRSAEATAAAAFHDAAARLAEIKEYASYFLAAKADALKLTVRNILVYAVLGVMALLMAGTAVIASVVLLLSGIAHGLGALFGGMYWLGDLVVGLVVLGAIAAGAVIGISMLTKSSRRSTVEKYESRKFAQHARFGQDVIDRAAVNQ